MQKSALFMVVILVATALMQCPPVLSADPAGTGQWKITSVKVCRNASGSINASLEVIGHFPVYSFFIPRPVWTVNGTVVDAQPVYERGRLVAFKLLNASTYLNSSAKNNVKFSLPDQNNSKVFHYDQTRPSAGDCYEFF